MAAAWSRMLALPPKPVPGPGQAGLVARVRQRLFPANTGTAKPPAPTRGITFNASIAEFLLVNRLKARSQRRAQAAEMLERASHIVFVTCKNWFTSGDDESPGGPRPL